MIRVIALIFLIICESAFSQELKVYKTNTDISKGYGTSLVLAKQDSNEDIFTVRKYYSNSAAPKGYYVEKYSKNLDFIDRALIPIEDNEIRSVHITKENVNLLQFEYSRKEKAYLLKLLSSPKAKFDFKEKVLFSIERGKIDKYDRFGIKEISEFPKLDDPNPSGIISESPNGQFIIYALPLKKDNRAIFFVFNKEFELLYQMEFFPKDEKGFVKLKEVIVTNNGYIFSTAEVYKNKSQMTEDGYTGKFDVKLFSISVEGQVEINFNPEENVIKNSKLFVNGTNIIFGGFYSTDKATLFSQSGISGTFRFDYNAEVNKSILNTFNSFSEKISTDYLFFKNSIFKDGSILFSLEAFQRGDKCYQFGSILATEISTNGSISWARVIAKDQNSCMGRRAGLDFSFLTLKGNNNTYYVLNLKQDTYGNKFDKERYGTIVIDKNGRIRMSQDYLQSTDNLTIIFQNNKPLSDESVLVEAIENGIYRLYKFETINN